jgi:hypothetical protein
MPADAGSISARFVMRDPTLSDALAKNLPPALDAIARQMAPNAEMRPAINVTRDGGDVVAHINLRAGSLAAFSTALQSRRAIRGK